MHVFAYLGIKFHITEKPDQESVHNCLLQAIRWDAVPYVWHLAGHRRRQAGKPSLPVTVTYKLRRPRRSPRAKSLK